MPGPQDDARVRDEIATLHGRCISQDVLDALPDAIGVYGTDGLLLANNEAFCAFWKVPAEHSLVGRLNLLTAPGVDPSDVALLHRAIAGERGMSPVNAIDLTQDANFAELGRQELWMQTLFAPLRVDGAVRFVMITFRDRSDDMRNQTRVNESEALVAAQRETIAALRSAQEHIRAQQDTIRELSTPIIEVWPGVLTLPVVGNIDEQRASEMTERLLASVTTMRARHVILDLTGVLRLDPATAGHLLRILRAVPLLGGQTMITGIHPDVAQTVVALGLDLSTVRTVRSLRTALAEIIGRAGPGGAAG